MSGHHPNYPVNLIVADRPCLVVGGGTVALRKASGLLEAGADVTVVAPEIHEDLLALNIHPIFKRYSPTDLDGVRLVITCTDDPAVNARVFADCESRGIWVNSADDLVNCAFTLPAVARQDQLSIAISTAGKSPAMASWLRKRFEAEFDQRYTDLLDLLAIVRAEAKAEIGTTEVSGWIESLDDGLLDLVASGQTTQAHQHLRSSLGMAVAS